LSLKSKISQEWIIFTAQKSRPIATDSNHISRLNLFFYKEGFSYCTGSGVRPAVSEFVVKEPNNWETEIIKEFEINLSLRRNFDQVKAAFVSSFFSVVPNEYSDESLEILLNFSEAEFEINKLFKSETRFGAQIVYGVSQQLIDRLNQLYSDFEFCHSGKLLIDTVSVNNHKIVHLNLNHHNLEILVTEGGNITFYNLFETPTGEDVLFYSLYAMEQLGLDTNSIQVKTYGELISGIKVFEILNKYIRNISQALKDDAFLKNYSLYKLMECELSQVHSEERK